MSESIKEVFEAPHWTRPHHYECGVCGRSFTARADAVKHSEACEEDRPREEWPSVMDYAATPFADNH
jgi:hypothetical protein